MTVFQLFLLALLTTPITALIKCSGKHSCYAESPECDPNTECQTVLHFDPIGNADIYVRNVSPTDYISLNTDWDFMNTREYFICLPFAGQRLRALGRSGQTLLFNQQNTTDVVERLDKNYFRCIINAKEFESAFRQYGRFVVARGKFQQILKVNKDLKLYKVEQEETNNIEDEIGTKNFIPIVYNVTAPIVIVDKSFYSLEEDPEVFKVLRKVEQFLYYSDNSKALGIVDDLNNQIELKVSKKQQQEKSADRQNKSQILDEDDDEKDVDDKVYVRMTQQRMYSFFGVRESSKIDKNDKEEEIVANDDADKEVYVLMTKRQMYTFVNRQAHLKMAHNKQDDDFKKQTFPWPLLLIIVRGIIRDVFQIYKFLSNRWARRFE